MSDGLIALKSPLEIGMPSMMNNGVVPELMELVPRMENTAGALGSPDCDNTVNPVAWPCSAWSKLGAGTSASFSDFTVDTEPAIVPFLRTP